MKYALAAVFFVFCFALSVAITCGTFGLTWLIIGAIANVAGWVLEPQTHVILAAVYGALYSVVIGKGYAATAKEAKR